jgi:transketolase
VVRVGRGSLLSDGGDGLLLAYGPVMLHEALTASEALRARGIRLAVGAMPWLNRVDPAWLGELAESYEELFVLEDHSPVGALGDTLRRGLSGLERPVRVTVFGVEGWPACGTPPEALRAHGLDGGSLAERIGATLAAAVHP